MLSLVFLLSIGDVIKEKKESEGKNYSGHVEGFYSVLKNSSTA